MADTVYFKQGSSMTVRPAGRLDSLTSPQLEKELLQHLDGIEEMVMDFASVDYISSAGLRVLLASEQLMAQRNGRLKVIHANRQVLEVFDLVGFAEAVEVIRE